MKARSSLRGKQSTPANASSHWMLRLPALSFFLVSQLAMAQAAPLYNSASNHYYEAVYVAGALTWDKAKAAAEATSYRGAQGHLVSIASAEENQFILDNFVLGGPTREYWIGSYQDTAASDYSEPSGGFRWVTGESFDYTNWRAGEPNNALGYPPAETYVQIKEDGRWNDLPASATQQGYIIEYEPTPPVGRDDVYYLLKGATVTVAAPGVLANDSGAAGSTLVAILDTPPTTGRLKLAANGGFVYTFTSKKLPTVFFTYRVSDGFNLSEPIMVTIQVPKHPNKKQKINLPPLSGIKPGSRFDFRV